VADLNPAVGADHLTAWADGVVVVVTAGRSSAEKVRTVGELIRAAGLDLRFAVLMHTERTDDSLGMADVERPTPLQLRDGHDHAESTGTSEVR
jgi:MinD-like ATPase involved in chromosome partitioning or flagellar assembly